jgi:hypothetical protein
VRTELGDGDGRWVSASVVCSSYAYAREQALAAAILAAAEDGGAGSAR